MGRPSVLNDNEYILYVHFYIMNEAYGYISDEDGSLYRHWIEATVKVEKSKYETWWEKEVKFDEKSYEKLMLIKQKYGMEDSIVLFSDDSFAFKQVGSVETHSADIVIDSSKIIERVREGINVLIHIYGITEDNKSEERNERFY